MRTFNDWVPFILLVTQVIQGLFLYAFRAALKIAILEAFEKIGEKFASKDDLRRVEQQVRLADRIDNGFAKTFAMLSARGEGDTRQTAAGARS